MFDSREVGPRVAMAAGEFAKKERAMGKGGNCMEIRGRLDSQLHV